eukprot:COSAG02_NODE_6739_length_3392_cov_4.852111_2_plen_122_part_00
MRGTPAVGCAGAVLVRFARSFVRFGSFERLLHLDLTTAEQRKQIETLANYCLRHYYPELLDEDDDTRAEAEFAAGVAERETHAGEGQAGATGAKARQQASIFRAFFATVSLAVVLIHPSVL